MAPRLRGDPRRARGADRGGEDRARRGRRARALEGQDVLPRRAGAPELHRGLPPARGAGRRSRTRSTKAEVPREGWLQHVLPTTDVWLLFPAKLYCGQSLLDGRRESVIIDYAYNDDLPGYQENPDALAGRNGLRIRDEIRMIRPGLLPGAGLRQQDLPAELHALQRRGGGGRARRLRRAASRWPRTAGSASRCGRRRPGEACACARHGQWLVRMTSRFDLTDWTGPAGACRGRRAGAVGRGGARDRRRGAARCSPELFPDGLPVPVRGGARPAAGGGRRGERADGADPARPVAAALRAPRPTTSPRRGSSSPSPATRRRARRRRGSPTGCSSATSRRPRWSRRSATTRRPGASTSRRSSATARPAPRSSRPSGGSASPATRATGRSSPGRSGRETNANPAVAARLAPLGASFHGAPVRADASTGSRPSTPRPTARRAAAVARPAVVRGLRRRRPAARRCSPPRCASALGGAPAAPGPQPAGFERRAAGLLAGRARGGLAGPAEPRSAAAGRPGRPRDRGRARPGDAARAGGALAAGRTASAAPPRLVAAQLTPGDLAWIDRASPPAARRRDDRSPADRVVDCAAGAGTRFACAGAGAEVAGLGRCRGRAAACGAAARSTACRAVGRLARRTALPDGRARAA